MMYTGESIGYYGPTSACLRLLVKAPDAAKAATAAGDFTVKGIHANEGDMAGTFEVEIELEPKDLEKILGKPGGGVSISAAYKMAKAAHEGMEEDDD